MIDLTAPFFFNDSTGMSYAHVLTIAPRNEKFVRLQAGKKDEVPNYRRTLIYSKQDILLPDIGYGKDIARISR
jgi:hypothetical protein